MCIRRRHRLAPCRPAATGLGRGRTVILAPPPYVSAALQTSGAPTPATSPSAKMLAWLWQVLLWGLHSLWQWLALTKPFWLLSHARRGWLVHEIDAELDKDQPDARRLRELKLAYFEAMEPVLQVPQRVGCLHVSLPACLPCTAAAASSCR